MAHPTVKFSQLVVAQYSATYVLYGLSTEGAVYKYQHTSGGWVKLPAIEVPAAAPRRQIPAGEEDVF